MNCTIIVRDYNIYIDGWETWKGLTKGSCTQAMLLLYSSFITNSMLRCKEVHDFEMEHFELKVDDPTVFSSLLTVH